MVLFSSANQASRLGLWHIGIILCGAQTEGGSESVDRAGHDTPSAAKVRRSPANPLSVRFSPGPDPFSQGRRGHPRTSFTHLDLAERKQAPCTGESSVNGECAASGAMQASFSGRALEGSLGHEEACWFSSPQALLRFDF